MPWRVRALYAPQNRFDCPPEQLGETYARLAERTDTWRSQSGGTELAGIYLDEHERPVAAPAFAYDAQARTRLWALSQEATGNQDWAW